MEAMVKLAVIGAVDMWYGLRAWGVNSDFEMFGSGTGLVLIESWVCAGWGGAIGREVLYRR